MELFFQSFFFCTGLLKIDLFDYVIILISFFNELFIHN